jgi:hypothetical protein
MCARSVPHWQQSCFISMRQDKIKSCNRQGIEDVHEDGFINIHKVSLPRPLLS